MREVRQKVTDQGGDQCHGGGGMKMLGMGGDRSPWWGQPLDGGESPPILDNPAL